MATEKEANEEVNEKPESLTISVDKATLDRLRAKMESKYNEFWGDVIDDEQTQTIVIANQLIPDKPFTINGKQYTYRQIGNKTWRDYVKLKTKADAEKNADAQIDLITEYYNGLLREFFGMTEDEADRIPPGEGRMAVDAAVYKVLHPIPLHPERLKSGSMQPKQQT